jgi:tryptophan synthase alpha chain
LPTLSAGDGGIQRTLAASLALIEGWITMLEIGVPFSDPIADGVVIQRAAARALSAGTTLREVLQLIDQIRKKSDIPIILFSYINPILYALRNTFLQDVKLAGVDGILLIDCPIEEANDFHEVCLQEHMAPIYIIATTTTTPTRICEINQRAKGFLYYACRQGTTGIQENLPVNFIEKMQKIKSNVNLPAVTGFGISTNHSAKKALQHADGVVVGSLFVKALEHGITLPELTQLATQINPFH